MTVVLALLRRVPVWLWAVIAAIAFGAWQRHRAEAAEKVHTQAVAKAAELREKKLEEDAAETARRLAETERAADEARKKSEALAADAQRSRRAAEQLRARLAASAADRGTPGPAAAGGSPAACEAGAVPADMFLSLVDRARVLAEAADASRIAGEACVAAYEGLKKGQ